MFYRDSLFNVSEVLHKCQTHYSVHADKCLSLDNANTHINQNFNVNNLLFGPEND